MLDHRLRQLPDLVNRNGCIRFVGESTWNQEYDRLFNEVNYFSILNGGNRFNTRCSIVRRPLFIAVSKAFCRI